MGISSGGQYEGNEGIKSTGPTTLERPDYSTQSDEDILGIDRVAPELGDLGPKKDTPAKPEQGDKSRTVKVDENEEILEDGEKPPDGEKPDEDEEKPEDKEKAKAEPKTPEEPLAPLKVSEELKAHFDDPKVGKQLKTAFYQAAAYKELFPDFQQAREIAELFPSAEEAKHVSDAYQGFRELQEAYEGDPATFVSKLHEEGEDEFAAIAHAVIDNLPTLQPAVYHDIGMQVLADTLAYCVQHTASIVAKSGLNPENLLAAADVIAMNLYNGKNVRELMDGSDDPRDQKIEHLETELKHERQSKTVGRANEFVDVVLTETDTKVDASINKVLDQVLDVEGVQVTKAARQKMGEEIKAAVTADIRANKRVGEAVIDLIRAKGGDYGDEHLQRCMEPILRQANLSVRKHAGQIIPNYTRNILSQHQQRMDKQRQAAERPDTGSGGGPRIGSVGTGTKVTPEMIDYSRTTDDQIMSDEYTLKR